MESSGWNTTWGTFLDEQLYRLALKRLRLGYYSCTMERDCIHFLQRCHKCQVHANLIYASPTELHNQTTPWTFAVYCLDIIGRLTRRRKKDRSGRSRSPILNIYCRNWLSERPELTNSKKKRVCSPWKASLLNEPAGTSRLPCLTLLASRIPSSNQ